MVLVSFGAERTSDGFGQPNRWGSAKIVRQPMMLKSGGSGNRASDLSRFLKVFNTDG
jgi:hypothetical protein